MTDIDKYTPEQFKHIYTKLRSAYIASFSESNQQAQTVKDATRANINSIKDQLHTVEQSYTIAIYGHAIVRLDSIVSGNRTISFDQYYRMDPIVQIQQEVVGFYKNGKARTRTVQYSYVRVSSNSSPIDIPAGHTITEAKRLIKELQASIANGATRRKELDAQTAKLKTQLSAAESDLSRKLAAVEEQSKQKQQKYYDAIDRLINGGTALQIRHLFKQSRLVLLASLILPGLLFIILSLAGFVNHAKLIAESNYQYSIDADNQLTFDCNLNYNQDKHYFYCSKQTYSGHLAKTDSTKLTNATSSSPTVNQSNFTASAPLQVITADDRADENISFNQTAEKYTHSTDKLILYNTILGQIVTQKEIQITWNFSQEDKDLMRKVWSEWKAEQENLARQKLAKKQAEAAAQKKAEQEAQQKAAEEAAEEAVKRQAEEQAKQKAAEAQTKKQNSSTSNSNATSKKSTTRTGAVCNDGSSSTATGSGACSRHGGVKYWTY